MNTFLKQFVKNPGKIGAIAESSNDLAKLMVKTAKLNDAQVIVEYGPGTGVFTQSILKKIGKGNKDKVFFALEINPAFVKEIQKRYPDATIYKDSAENIDKYLKIHGVEKADCIISSIPWTLLPEKKRQNILSKTLKVLKPGGKFLTFMYTHSLITPMARDFHDSLKKNFRHVKKTKTVWKNFPPAFVYSCLV